jgi:small-conductance mechanosensitive channel
MQTSIFKFLIRLSLYSLGISGLAGIFYYFFPNSFNLFAFLLLQACVLMVTIIVHVSLIKYSYAEGRPEKFVTRYIAVTVIKLFAYIGVLAGYIVISKYLLHRQQSYLNIVVIFFILYVLYTVFEVPSIMKFIRRKGSGND